MAGETRKQDVAAELAEAFDQIASMQSYDENVFERAARITSVQDSPHLEDALSDLYEVREHWSTLKDAPDFGSATESDRLRLRAIASSLRSQEFI